MIVTIRLEESQIENLKMMILGKENTANKLGNRRLLVEIAQNLGLADEDGNLDEFWS